MSKRPVSSARSKYQFIKSHSAEHDVHSMCRLLGVARSGYYKWLKQPVSNRAEEDVRLLRLIRASFLASQGIYGAPRVFLDLREAGETCSKHRVARLMRVNNLRALHGYRMRRWSVSRSARSPMTTATVTPMTVPTTITATVMLMTMATVTPGTVVSLVSPLSCC